jgi:transcriptional regulator with XRE-family HTH domain
MQRLFLIGAASMKPRSQEPGNKNIIGSNVIEIRKSRGMKQKELLTKLQISGVDMSATSLSRLEGQYRLATDIEVLAVAEALDVDIKDLLRRDLVE